jgi:hypothetical protein
MPVIYGDRIHKQNSTCGVLRKIAVHALREVKRNIDFVETCFTGWKDFIYLFIYLFTYLFIIYFYIQQLTVAYRTPLDFGSNVTQSRPVAYEYECTVPLH